MQALQTWESLSSPESAMADSRRSRTMPVAVARSATALHAGVLARLA